MILSEKIIHLRKQNGWSQEQLAEQLNVSRQSVSLFILCPIPVLLLGGFAEAGFFSLQEDKAGAIGVALCILSVIPVILFGGFSNNDFLAVLCVILLLTMIAVDVHLFIRAGMTMDSYNKLLQEKDYTKEKKALSKKTQLVSGIYRGVITSIFLFISFYSGQWHRTWMIWPAAGVSYAVILGVAELVIKKKGKRFLEI